MQACLERARLAARTDLPVLILGESGTGKTILARAIHNSSARAGGPFVSFNAAALSETLIDSQLFGHERGAFTGAQSRVKGKFELADRGTLFLDEIADLSPQGQSKILRAIEYGEFERLGSETLRTGRCSRACRPRTIRAAALVRERHVARRPLLSHQRRHDPRAAAPRIARQDLPALVASEIARASQMQGKSIARTRPRRGRPAVRVPTGRATSASSRRSCRPRSRSRPNPIIPVTALLFQTDLESDPDEPPDDTARGRASRVASAARRRARAHPFRAASHEGQQAARRPRARHRRAKRSNGSCER